MEQSSFRSLPKVSVGTLNDKSNSTTPPLAQQLGHQQGVSPARPDAPRTTTQPRVSQRQFQESVNLLYHRMDTQNDHSRPHRRDEHQERAVTKKSGLVHSQRCYDFNTPLQMTADDSVPEATSPGVPSTGEPRNSRRPSYVEKQREAQKVHSKTHPGVISSLIQPHAHRHKRKVWKAISKGRLARRRQCQAVSDETSPIHFRNQQVMTATPNWPFGVNPTSRRNNVSGRVQHYPLTNRELQLLLRNPRIRDGNIGSLPTPGDLTRHRPHPHLYGIGPEPPSIGRAPQLPHAVRRLTGLKRRNAQRGKPRSPAQEGSVFFHGHIIPRFRRGRAAKDVSVVYSSPVELARRKSILPQIQEVDRDSSDDESCHNSAPQDKHTSEVKPDGEPPLEPPQNQKENDESPMRLGFPIEVPVSLPAPETESHGSEQNDRRQVRPATSLRRLSFVIMGPRPDPRRASLSSCSSSSPPSTTETPANNASIPASEPQLKLGPESESEHFAEDGTCRNPAGCTWPDCSRIRGTFRVPVPVTMETSKPEHDRESAVNRRNEDEFSSIGNGLAFLKLN